jgi:glutathione-independent formaldehyde dehydrogenase
LRGPGQHALADRALEGPVELEEAVDATVITLDDAPTGYRDFDSGAARKYVIDPHGLIAA